MAKTTVKSKEVNGWVGWVAFAGVLAIVLGAFQALAGIVALFKKAIIRLTHPQQRCTMEVWKI